MLVQHKTSIGSCMDESINVDLTFTKSYRHFLEFQEYEKPSTRTMYNNVSQTVLCWPWDEARGSVRKVLWFQFLRAAHREQWNNILYKICTEIVLIQIVQLKCTAYFGQIKQQFSCTWIMNFFHEISHKFKQPISSVPLFVHAFYLWYNGTGIL
jgi:hypothetical protein